VEEDIVVIAVVSSNVVRVEVIWYDNRSDTKGNCSFSNSSSWSNNSSSI